MKSEVIEKLAALITAAFGLVAALAWNGAIQGIFNKYYAVGEGLGALVWYAVIVTIIAVLLTIWIGKISERAKKVDARIVERTKDLAARARSLTQRRKDSVKEKK